MTLGPKGTQEQCFFLDPWNNFWCQNAARIRLLVATPVPPTLPTQRKVREGAGMGRSCPKSSWAVLAAVKP